MGDLKKLDELVLMDFMLHYCSEILKRNTDAKKQDFFIALSKSIHKTNFFFVCFLFCFSSWRNSKGITQQIWSLSM